MNELVIKVSTQGDPAGANLVKAALDALSQAGIQATAQEHSAAQGADQAAQATGRFVDSVGRLREANGRFVTLAQQAAEAGKQIETAGHGAKSFFDTVKEGFGIDIGHRFIDGFAEIPGLFTEAIHRGIEYNAEMQTMARGLGAALEGVQPEKYLNFEQARKAGVAALDQLRDKANSLGLEFKPLAETFSVAMPTMMESGITKMSDQMDVMIRLSQMAAAKNLSGNQAMRDILDELTGRGERTMFGKELDAVGLTSKALEEAKANGTEASLILQKTASYGEAAADGANSYAGALRTVHNEIEQLEGEIAKPVFEKLASLLQGGKGALGSTAASGAAEGVGHVLSGVLDDVQSKTTAVESFLSSHPMMARLLGGLPGAVGRAVGLPIDDQDTLANGLITNIGAGQDDAAIDAQIKLVSALREKVSAAKDDKAQAEARKLVEDAIAAATERTASAQGDAKERAHEFLIELQAIQDGLGKNLGNAKPDTEAADRAAKRNAEAQGKYEADPRSQSAQAGLDADAAAAASDKHRVQVQKDADELQKKWVGMSRQQAEADAEREITGSEVLKGAQALNKELDATIAKEEKLASSADVAAKLRGVYGSILDKLPEGARSGLSDATTNDNLRAVSTAVEGVPVNPGDKASLDAKKALVDLLKEALQLQRDYDEAVGKEATAKAKDDRESKRNQENAQRAAEEAKQRSDVIADEREQIAIDQARARGDQNAANALEKQRDIRLEITRLMQAGLSYAEAQTLAEQKITAENDSQDRKQADKYATRHPGDLPLPVNAKPVDTDPGGGLHTETLGASSAHRSSTTTDANPNGGLSTGGFGPGGTSATSTAGAALANAHDPSNSLDTDLTGADLALQNAPSAADFLGRAVPMAFTPPSAAASIAPAPSPIAGASGNGSGAGTAAASATDTATSKFASLSSAIDDAIERLKQIATMKGPKGDPGTDGQDGLDGLDGQDGGDAPFGGPMIP